MNLLKGIQPSADKPILKIKKTNLKWTFLRASYPTLQFT